MVSPGGGGPIDSPLKAVQDGQKAKSNDSAKAFVKSESDKIPKTWKEAGQNLAIGAAGLGAGLAGAAGISALGGAAAGEAGEAGAGASLTSGLSRALPSLARGVPTIARTVLSAAQFAGGSDAGQSAPPSDPIPDIRVT